jgi:hypothetical protein
MHQVRQTVYADKLTCVSGTTLHPVLRVFNIIKFASTSTANGGIQSPAIGQNYLMETYGKVKVTFMHRHPAG